MSPSYIEAIRMIESEASRRAAVFRSRSENVPVSGALNRIAARTQRSPLSTPEFNTSAMDGFALNSDITAGASAQSPVIFEYKGSMAAGDGPISISGEPESGIYPCVEIMTGARFPNSLNGRPFNCCIRWEDTVSFTDSSSNRRYIKVMKSAKCGQHRRLAAEDFTEGDVIVHAGATIRPRNIMALASVGITEVAVLRKPLIGVFSTGSELIPPGASMPDVHRIRDSNGPYITATLKDWDVDVDFLGVLEDDDIAMAQSIKKHLEKDKYDMIISTGAVSAGRFDLIPVALQHLASRIVFHKIAIRPGHPALFASIPLRSVHDNNTLEKVQTDIAFFGMPGNPLASAACLRFLVLPYLKALQSQDLEGPLKATIRRSPVSDCDPTMPSTSGDLIASFPADNDIFRPGIFYYRSGSELELKLIDDHSPGKVKPFVGANCWVHISRVVTELRDGDLVDCFPIH